MNLENEMMNSDETNHLHSSGTSIKRKLSNRRAQQKFRENNQKKHWQMVEKCNRLEILNEELRKSESSLRKQIHFLLEKQKLSCSCASKSLLKAADEKKNTTEIIKNNKEIEAPPIRHTNISTGTDILSQPLLSGKPINTTTFSVDCNISQMGIPLAKPQSCVSETSEEVEMANAIIESVKSACDIGSICDIVNECSAASECNVAPLSGNDLDVFLNGGKCDAGDINLCGPFACEEPKNTYSCNINDFYLCKLPEYSSSVVNNLICNPSFAMEEQKLSISECLEKFMANGAESMCSSIQDECLPLACDIFFKNENKASQLKNCVFP
ncbi:hypothetical protein QEN19_000865 [Hanseniaspora menglaensis]